jgi:hypothetical protein
MWTTGTWNGCLSDLPFYIRISQWDLQTSVSNRKTRCTLTFFCLTRLWRQCGAACWSDNLEATNQRLWTTSSASYSNDLFSAVWSWRSISTRWTLFTLYSVDATRRWLRLCVLLCRMCKKKNLMVLKVPAFYQWFIMATSIGTRLNKRDRVVS